MLVISKNMTYNNAMLAINTTLAINFTINFINNVITIVAKELSFTHNTTLFLAMPSTCKAICSRFWLSKKACVEVIQ